MILTAFLVFAFVAFVCIICDADAELVVPLLLGAIICSAVVALIVGISEDIDRKQSVAPTTQPVCNCNCNCSKVER